MTDKLVFNIHIETDVELTVDEIWPDGDAPENPTVRTVVNTKKFKGFTPRELAVIVLNRMTIASDRLGHETGAVNWK